MQLLRDHKIVVSQRGVGGGIRLAKPANELTILNIVDAVEPIERIKSCPLEIAGHGINLCPLHRRLDNAMAQIEQSFASSTLADLLHDDSGITPLCPFPNVKRVPT
jgi:Rrf2 family nitric oxide-sensitive transcriptional repressor